MTTPTASSHVALTHLKRLKPLDGWALECSTNSSTVRLLRRNVPVSSTYFVDLYVMPDTKQVVGLLTENNRLSGQAQGQVLVDERGNLLNDVKIVTVKGWSKTASSSSSFAPRSNLSTSNANHSSSSSSSSSSSPMSLEEHKQLLQYAGYAIGAAILLKIIISTMSGLLILVVPAVYLYGVSTCPAEDSFDAKQQLKRVLRGHHLPESHPDKPKGFLSETLARLQATVATEVSTSLGYEMTILSLAGAGLLATVRVSSIDRTIYWLGANNAWYYLYSTSNSSSKPKRAVQGIRRKVE